MAAWEDNLPPLVREKLASIGEPTPQEKARMKEVDNPGSTLAEFFKGHLGPESLLGNESSNWV